ncbi:GatB/YqeY domain-containing protein [Micromonospora carbonacea]|uniref:GatB/YqeY domain-containing protein n=1 Tax=Micromonospora carbonacea TaxID=47853 RepID=UPI00371E81A7
MVTEIGGPAAELILAADISQYGGSVPTPIQRPERLPTDGELRNFGASCEAYLAQAQSKLLEALNETTPFSCIGLAILLGQVTLEVGLVTASPNAFSFEIELISTLDSRTSWSSSFLTDEPQATLDALVAARQINIASHLQVMVKGLLEGPSSRESLGQIFRIEWLSGRGRSVTAFDLRCLAALKQRMVEHGIETPDPQLAVSLITPFVERWSKVISKAMRALDPESYIRQAIGSQSLLSSWPCRLAAAEVSTLKKLLPTLSLTREDLLRSYKEPHRRQVEYWLRFLSLEASSQHLKNPNVNALVDAELKHRPIIQSGKRLLLALPHRLATDFSALFDTAMAREYGEKYFAVRAAEVEDSSLEAIKLLTPGCRFVSAARYVSADKGVEGEVDGIVLWEDICFVLEGKGGYLSTAARKGSTEAVIADLKQTVSEGYFQAARLLGILDREGSVKLTRENSTSLTIAAKEIRKAYILLPTADDFGQVATRLGILWGAGLLPSSATPLIISIQDLLLVMEVLQTAENFVAYLDFREEVLLNNWIDIVDELEMLGTFVGGMDVVGSSVSGIRQGGMTGDLHAKWNKHSLHVAPVQQERYLNPWLSLKYGKSFSGNPLVSPPTRHGPLGQQILQRSKANGNSLGSITKAICLDPELLTVLLATSHLGQQNRIGIRKHDGIVAVAYAPSLGLDKARRDHRVKAASKSARYVVFVEESPSRPSCVTLVEFGLGHASWKSPKANLCSRSNVSVKDGWYQRFQQRRTRAFDKAVVAGLEAIGVPRDMAIGIDRNGLSERVLAAAELKGDPLRVASLWLSYLKEFSAGQEVNPAQLPISDATVVELTELVRLKVIIPQQLRPIIEELARGQRSLKEIVVRQRASGSAGADRINAAIVEVFKAHQDVATQAKLGKQKCVNFLMGQVLKEMKGAAMPDEVLQLLNHALGR